MQYILSQVIVYIVEYAQKPKILMNFVDEWFQAKVQTVVFDLRYFSIDCSHHHTIRIRSKRIPTEFSSSKCGGHLAT